MVDGKMTNFVAVLTIKSGKRSEYAAELRRLQLIENFRKQKGNIYYQIGESITDSDKMVVSDAWEKEADFKAHCSSELVQNEWNELYNKYVEAEVSDVYEK